MVTKSSSSALARSARAVPNTSSSEASADAAAAHSSDAVLSTMVDMQAASPLSQTEEEEHVLLQSVAAVSSRLLRDRQLSALTGANPQLDSEREENYVKLCGLNAQAQATAAFLRGVAHEKENSSMLMVGPRGSGRTAVLHSALLAMHHASQAGAPPGVTPPQPFMLVYLDGSTISDETAAVREIARQLSIDVQAEAYALAAATAVTAAARYSSSSSSSSGSGSGSSASEHGSSAVSTPPRPGAVGGKKRRRAEEEEEEEEDDEAEGEGDEEDEQMEDSTSCITGSTTSPHPFLGLLAKKRLAERKWPAMCRYLDSVSAAVAAHGGARAAAALQPALIRPGQKGRKPGGGGHLVSRVMVEAGALADALFPGAGSFAELKQSMRPATAADATAGTATEPSAKRRKVDDGDSGSGPLDAASFAAAFAAARDDVAAAMRQPWSYIRNHGGSAMTTAEEMFRQALEEEKERGPGNGVNRKGTATAVARGGFEYYLDFVVGTLRQGKLQETWRESVTDAAAATLILGSASSSSGSGSGTSSCTAAPIRPAGPTIASDSCPVFIVIDDIDVFAAHKRQTLLYSLLDLTQSAAVHIGIIGTTTRVDVLEKLEKRLKSRFSSRVVDFTPASVTGQDMAAYVYHALRLPAALAAAHPSFASRWESQLRTLTTSMPLAQLIVDLKQRGAGIGALQAVLGAYLAAASQSPSLALSPESLLPRHLAPAQPAVPLKQRLASLTVQELLLLCSLCHLHQRDQEDAAKIAEEAYLGSGRYADRDGYGEGQGQGQGSSGKSQAPRLTFSRALHEMQSFTSATRGSALRKAMDKSMLERGAAASSGSSGSAGTAGSRGGSGGSGGSGDLGRAGVSGSLAVDGLPANFDDDDDDDADDEEEGPRKRPSKGSRGKGGRKGAAASSSSSPVGAANSKQKPAATTAASAAAAAEEAAQAPAPASAAAAAAALAGTAVGAGYATSDSTALLALHKLLDADLLRLATSNDASGMTTGSKRGAHGGVMAGDGSGYNNSFGTGVAVSRWSGRELLDRTAGLRWQPLSLAITPKDIMACVENHVAPTLPTELARWLVRGTLGTV